MKALRGDPPGRDTLVVVGQVLWVRRDHMPTAGQQAPNGEALVPRMADLVQHPSVDAPADTLLDVGCHQIRIELRGLSSDQVPVVLEQRVARQPLSPVAPGQWVRPIPGRDDRRQSKGAQQSLLIFC